jgi:glyoxylase-like metal-dependent hydrolase (beta-lactamase superfamily II)
MAKGWIVAVALVGAMASTAAAQDAKTVVANASRAMGVDGLTSIHYYGVASIGNLGQNNNANQPWPLTAANDYVRAIDFTQPASRATWVTYAVPVTGGAAVLAQNSPQTQQVITPQNSAWAQQLEIWTTPWGFLKGAAATSATARSQTVNGRRFQVVTFNAPVKSPSGQPYRVVGYINGDNMVERVQTWLEHPIFGDMLVEADYLYYRDNYGLKYPARMVQKRAGWPTFEAFILGAHANPANLQTLLGTAAPAAGRGAVAGPSPAAAQTGGARGGGAPAAPPAPAAYSEQLAPGVFRIGQKPAAGTYNALAIEFADHILLYEPGPQSIARAEAVIAEAKRAIPNKPIRYGVISHHHADHTGGLAAVVAEGITIVTPEVNRAYLMSALSAPRTLLGDGLAKSGRKPQIEGFKGDRRVFQDGTRTFEAHVIQGLPHADGNVIGYLPKERILIYADMFNLPPAGTPVPNPPVVGSGVFADNIERLKLDVDRIVSVHGLDPNNDGRLTSVKELRASLGRK